MVAHQVAELLLQIVTEKLGAGDRCRVDARGTDIAERESGIDVPEAARLDADLWIAGAETGERFAALAEPLEGLAKEAGVALVERLEAVDGLGRVVEELRLKGLGSGGGEDGV